MRASRIIILYKTKYGSTRRYAQWIAEITGGDLYDLSLFDPNRLAQYETVLIGSSAYFGKMRCSAFLMKNWEILKNKKIIVFGVTGISPNDPRQRDIAKRSFPKRFRSSITYYPLRGAFNYKGLKCLDKLLMSGPKIRFQLRWMLLRDKKAKELLKKFETPMDWTSREATKALCSSILHFVDPGN
jgi:menaquinone-dependent protoporphyrinogen IX oxidase